MTVSEAILRFHRQSQCPAECVSGVMWVCGLWSVLGHSGSLRPQRLCVCGLGCRVLLFSAQCAVCSVQCAVCSVQCWRPAVARRWSVVCASVVFGLRQSSIFFNLTRSCSRSTKWCGPQSHNAKLELQPQHVRSTSGCSVFCVPVFRVLSSLCLRPPVATAGITTNQDVRTNVVM